MSFVVLYATDKGAVLKGDSRMCSSETEVASEGYNKVCKINENLIMGYTGGVEFTLRVLVETTFKNYGKSGISDYAAALKKSIIANIHKKTIKNPGGSFIAAGFEDSNMKVYIARCNKSVFDEKVLEIQAGEPYIFAIGTCDKDPEVFAGEEFSNSDGTVEERLNSIICKAADLSNYVNKNIVTVSIGDMGI